MGQVILNELRELLWCEIDALEAVHPEELAGLRQVQRLAHVGVDLRHEIRRHVRRPPQRKPGGGRETRHARLGNRRQIRAQQRPLCARGGEDSRLPGLLVFLDAAEIETLWRLQACPTIRKSLSLSALAGVWSSPPPPPDTGDSPPQP